MAIAGASRFIGAATLANTQGRAAVQSQVLGGGSALNLVDAAKAFRVKGSPGLSASARQVNARFLNATGGGAISLFGLTSGSSLSTSDLAAQIKAKRSSLPQSQISDLVIAAEKAREEEQAEALEDRLVDEAIKNLKIKKGITDAELERELDNAVRILRAQEGNTLTQSSSFRRGQLQDSNS